MTSTLDTWMLDDGKVSGTHEFSDFFAGSSPHLVVSDNWLRLLSDPALNLFELKGMCPEVSNTVVPVALVDEPQPDAMHPSGSWRYISRGLIPNELDPVLDPILPTEAALLLGVTQEGFALIVGSGAIRQSCVLSPIGNHRACNYWDIIEFLVARALDDKFDCGDRANALAQAITDEFAVAFDCDECGDQNVISSVLSDWGLDCSGAMILPYLLESTSCLFARTSHMLWVQSAKYEKFVAHD